MRYKKGDKIPIPPDVWEKAVAMKTPGAHWAALAFLMPEIRYLHDHLYDCSQAHLAEQCHVVILSNAESVAWTQEYTDALRELDNKAEVE